MNSIDLSGRVALVTGGGRGIGKAISRRLAEAGANVVIASRKLENLESTAKELSSLPGKVIPLACHVGRPDQLENLIKETESRLGPVEILVTNTGGPPLGRSLSHEPADWELAYRSLVLAPRVLAKAVVPGMQEHGWGRIVNVGSFTVREPAPGLMLSNSHRSAALAAFKTIARNVAASGVTVNSVLPGRIATDRAYELAGSRERAEQAGRTEAPAGRLGTPEEVAAAVAFLCSQQASYVTGVLLPIDGGFTAQ